MLVVSLPVEISNIICLLATLFFLAPCVLYWRVYCYSIPLCHRSIV